MNYDFLILGMLSHIAANTESSLFGTIFWRCIAALWGLILLIEVFGG